MHGVWVRPSLATVTPYPVVASRLGDELDLRKIDCCKMKEVVFAQGDTYRYFKYCSYLQEVSSLEMFGFWSADSFVN